MISRILTFLFVHYLKMRVTERERRTVLFVLSRSLFLFNCGETVSFCLRSNHSENLVRYFFEIQND